MSNKKLRFNPSSSERWIKCPASVQLSAEVNIDDINSNKRAYIGKVIHKASELLLKGKECYPHMLLEFEECGEYVCEYLTQNQYDEALHYANYVKGYMYNDCCYLFVEKEISLSHILPNTTGHADAIIINTETNSIHIFDLKTGDTPIQAMNNTQMILYAYGFVDNPNCDMKAVLHVVQNNERVGDNTNRWSTTIVELRDYVDSTVKEAVRDALSDNPTLCAGEIQCEHCPANIFCSSFHEKDIDGIF